MTGSITGIPGIATRGEVGTQTGGAATHAGAPEEDHVGAVLLDGFHRLVGQRAHEPLVMLELEHRDVDRADRAEFVARPYFFARSSSSGTTASRTVTMENFWPSSAARCIPVWAGPRTSIVRRLSSGVHAWVAEAVDHDCIDTLLLGLHDLRDRVRQRERLVERGLDRGGADSIRSG